MNRCKPSYCVPGSYRNWTRCNMSNLGGKYKHTCRNEKHCVLSKRTKKTKNSVDAKTLHAKMPYIWRFLKPKTRKHMIYLAKQPVNKINIPSHVFPDGSCHKHLDKKLENKYKTLRKSIKIYKC